MLMVIVTVMVMIVLVLMVVITNRSESLVDTSASKAWWFTCG